MENPLDEFSFSDPFASWWPFIIALIVGVTTAIRGYLGGPKCPSEATISGKTVVITGGSNGIGLEVVIDLIKRGGKIIIGTRNVKDTKEILRRRGITVNDETVLVKKLDLSLLRSVISFAEDLVDEPKIDVLINNAGIIFCPFEKTDEGFERHFVTNYLSHFLLTHLLLQKLEEANQGRIINVSAQAHYVSEIFLDDFNIEKHFTSSKAFGQSKLALAMMAHKMAKDLEGTNVTINAMHPGLVRDTLHMKNSPFNRSLLVKVATWPWVWLLMKTPQQGAQTIIYLAVAPELSKISGKYFSNCSATEPSEKVYNKDIVKELYDKSMDLCMSIICNYRF